MGEMIQFKRPDGKTCPSYLAPSKAGSSAPGFVVIQEWWGLNDQIKKTADRLAEAGYRALVPDFYRGKVTTVADEANHLMTSLNFPDAAGQDIRGAVQYLKPSKKVAVGGFCMGGAPTILSAVRVPEMDAGACFYGIPPLDAADLKKIKIPLICHFADKTTGARPPRRMTSRSSSRITVRVLSLRGTPRVHERSTPSGVRPGMRQDSVGANAQVSEGGTHVTGRQPRAPN